MPTCPSGGVCHDYSFTSGGSRGQGFAPSTPRPHDCSTCHRSPIADFVDHQTMTGRSEEGGPDQKCHISVCAFLVAPK